MTAPEEKYTDNYYAEDDILLPILAALEEENYQKVRDAIDVIEPSEKAELLNVCDKGVREKIISIIGGIDAEIIPFLDSEVVEELSDIINTKLIAEEIEKLESDDAVQFVEDLSEEKRDEVLEALTKETKEEIKEALNYHEDSARRLANTQFVTAKYDATVGDVIDLLRTSNDLPQDFYTIFILDEEGKPESFIPLSRITRNKRDVKLSELKEDNLKAIHVDTKQEDVANLFRKHGLISAPVIDEKGVMIGVITVDDITYVIDEEAEKDLLQLAGLSADADIFSPVIKKLKNRTPWLLVNLFSSLMVSIIISLFEASIHRIIALAALMPVVASLSGISGSQALTISVRAIATNQLTFLNFFRVLRKEVLTSLLNGLLIGSFVFLGSYLLYQSIDLSGVMMLAIILTFLISALAGASIPIILDSMKIDPAIASSAIVLALTDVSSFFIFLGLATALL
ncbi:MAG TPA: magnesium transporter [Alphaproteobacteria bacterium]|nr:magnesium transporter [Alphaproteobacteria bacterium]